MREVVLPGTAFPHASPPPDSGTDGADLYQPGAARASCGRDQPGAWVPPPSPFPLSPLPSPGDGCGGASYFSGSKPVAVAAAGVRLGRCRCRRAWRLGRGRRPGPSAWARRRGRRRPRSGCPCRRRWSCSGRRTAAPGTASSAAGSRRRTCPWPRFMYECQISDGNVRAGHVGAVVEPEHLRAVVGIADPHGGRQPRREAHEPRVGELVGGARLAGRRAVDLRRGAGAAGHVLLEDLGRLGGHAVLERLRAPDLPARRAARCARPGRSRA